MRIKVNLKRKVKTIPKNKKKSQKEANQIIQIIQMKLSQMWNLIK